jgi:PAS domain-containing protein
MLREYEVQELLEGSADACFVSGPDGLIRAWNQASDALFGFTAMGDRARVCAAIVQGRNAGGGWVCRTGCAVQQMALKDERIQSFEMEIRTSSGERRWMAVSIIVASSTKGEKLLIHLCRDVESRKRMELITERFLLQVGSLTGREVQDLISPSSQ